MSDIVVLGSINMDLVVRSPQMPRPGETLRGSGFGTVAGGKGAIRQQPRLTSAQAYK